MFNIKNEKYFRLLPQFKAIGVTVDQNTLKSHVHGVNYTAYVMLYRK